MKGHIQVTSSISKAALRGATCLTAFAFLNTGAYGQDTSIAPAEDTAQEATAIVVTGSRIRSPNLDSIVPVTVLGGNEFIAQGQTNVGDTLNDLPQLRSTFSQQNPGLGVGIAGLNLLDLRGLGTQRTLVLVNGRRHVAADVLNNGVSTDINTIPANLIDRVDVVTGGNSAIYGSDAIAGVVNFILKQNFDGLEITGKAGISTPGAYGGNQYLSGLFGKNFADGRGNVTLAVEFSSQDRVFASDVPFLRTVNGLGVNDTDRTGLTNGSDGNPDRVFFRDIRSASINRYGLVPITQRAGSAGCGTGVSNGVTPGVPYNCTYIFQPDGTLVPQTGTRYSTGVIGGIVGGNGQTGREQELYSVLPGQKRYNANLLGHFEVTPALDLFVEAKYSRIDTTGSNAGPNSIQGTFQQFDARERVRLDNPFLNSAARQTITNAILASGCNTSINTACSTVNDPTNRNPSSGALTPEQIAAVANGSYRFVIARNLSDIGNRDERFRRETYRAVIGARGGFWDDWNYEISANYGRTEEHTDASGYLDKQRFNLAMDAGRNPLTGQIQCRSQFDPAAATAGPNNAFNRARLTADIAACVPYNPFGAANNAASAAYFQRNYTNDSWAEQFVISAFVSGTTSSFFNLPGGPLRFALGAEHRQEDTHYEQDEFAASGNSTAVAFGSYDPAKFKVSEAFGELQVPILKDRPFFHDLTLSGAARVAKYQGGTGTVWAWNAGGEWAPIRDIRFRANYSRAVRAPNQAETSSPLVENFAPAFQDPCSASNIGAGTQFRAANCQAAVGANLVNLASLGQYSLPIVSGSSPDLQAETSKSLTLGAVVQPRFIPGLSIAVDYFNIKVSGVIVSLSAQQIVNSCYDQPTLDNQFCGLFQRFAGPGNGPFNETPGAVLGNSLISSPLNFAKRVRRGIDTQINYRADLTDNLRLSTSLLYTHSLKNSNYENPTNPNFENRLLGELGDPEDEVRLTVDLKRGPFTIGYQMRYIGPMWVNNYEDFNSLQGRPPQDEDYADIRQYPSVSYHDLRFEWEIKPETSSRSFTFFTGVDNMFNKIPPLGSTATGERIGGGGNGGPIYSVRGRQFYAGFKAGF